MAIPDVVFVLGGPGAGKGTQCARIVQEFGFVHLSAGDLLRAERTKGGTLGTMISDYIKEGKIIPVEITIRLIKEAMDANIKESRTKFLIDGFPRNEDNLSGWEKIMTGLCDVKFVLFLNCSAEVMEKRLLGRNEGRADDNIASIRKRFKTYIESTMPIIQRFEKRGKVREIDAAQSVDAVSAAIAPLFTSLASSTTELVDPVKKRFNNALRESVRNAMAGDAEAGAAKEGKKTQYWEMPVEKQKELLLGAVKATLFNPRTEQEDVMDVKWEVSNAFFMSISGGYHVNVTETKTSGKVVYHHCRVNCYGVCERYQTPEHPPVEGDAQEAGDAGCSLM